jgi:hypothetical protein
MDGEQATQRRRLPVVERNLLSAPLKDLTNAQFSILIGWEFRIEHWSDGTTPLMCLLRALHHLFR